MKNSGEQLTSIIVPAFREAGNIEPLARRIEAAMKASGLLYEMIIVDDDSCDGTYEEAEKLKHAHPLRIIIRKNERGLASAVIEGFRHARGSIICVMDADLSHPPEKIPDLVKEITVNRAEFALASRFARGGSVPHFGFYRKLNALAARLLARPLTAVSDPMAGFFAFPAVLLQRTAELNPLGFKIGLELLIKSGTKNISEVPIIFSERLHGESKLGVREQLNYLRHLKRLYHYRYRTLTGLFFFSLIGSSGMLIDLAAVHASMLFLASIMEGDPVTRFRIARCSGFVFALSSNFLLNRKFNFPDKRESPLPGQYLRFFAVSLCGFAVNWIISVELFRRTAFFTEHYLIASMAGIVGGLIINFSGSRYIVFKASGRKI